MEATASATNLRMLVAHGSFATSAAVIDALARRAVESGYATDEYGTAVLAREQEYPTGLPTEIPIALPHVRDGCLCSFLACATLHEPVGFWSMDGSDEPLDIRIVFMFGITDPSQQAPTLRTFSLMFRDGAYLRSLLDAPDEGALMDLLKQRLGRHLDVLPAPDPCPSAEFES